MGLNRCFQLDIYGQEGDLSEIINDFNDFHTQKGNALTFDQHGSNTDYLSWIKVEEDMKLFSKRHPKVTLQLEVEEGNGDKWRGYFRNGKMQKCYSELVWEPFNPKKFK